VLGMAPLLFERSQQAQFLKPTIITLVYGLGFGMILVLLVVPALVAAQHDVARQIAAMRRGLRTRARGLQLGLITLWVMISGWGMVTMGVAAWSGALYPPLAKVLPSAAAAMPAMPVAFLLFTGGAAVLALAGYVLGGILLAVRKPTGA